MNKNLQSPTKLTEFAPLQQEEKPQSVGQFISKLFKITKTEESQNSDSSASVPETIPSWAKETSESSDSSLPSIYPVDLNEGRSLPNVLKRISNLLALKTNNLQAYADTELKQYWMPDSVSKECYECSEKFTTFRRRHHCRVCGQIFCSQCCNQQIPGKIFGCTGDLRVCTYCCKVVLSYLQSSNFGANLSADLKALQENLQSKFGESTCGLLSNDSSPSAGLNVSESGESLRRKISVGYQEEKFASGSINMYLTNEEKCKALQNSVSLRNLFDEICKPTSGVNFMPYKYRLRTYPECFLGSELVDWLICQQKAKTRVQAAALAQALLEGSYIESFSESSSFVDGYVRYRKGNLFSTSFTQLSPNYGVPAQEEPSWVQQIPNESSNTETILRAGGAEQYITNFQENKIDSYVLKLLSDEDLEAVGVEDAALRDKLLDQFKNLQIPTEKKRDLTVDNQFLCLILSQINVQINKHFASLCYALRRKDVDICYVKVQPGLQCLQECLSSLENEVENLEKAVLLRNKPSKHRSSRVFLLGSLGVSATVLVLFAIAKYSKWV